MRAHQNLQAQAHVGIAFDEASDHLRQDVARIGVGGRDGEHAGLDVREGIAQRRQALDVVEDALGDLQHVFARFGQPHHPVAVALEDRETDLGFEPLDLLADARLRGVEALRRGRHIEIVVRHFPYIAQLLQFHAILRNRPGAGVVRSRFWFRFRRRHQTSVDDQIRRC